jgi:PAS domain S-box-containing protein
VTRDRGRQDPSSEGPPEFDSTSGFSVSPQSAVHAALGEAADAAHWQSVVGRELVNSSMDGVFATDAQFLVRTWSRGLERLTGHPAEYALGRDLLDVLPVSNRDALAEALRGRAVTVGPDRWAVAATGHYGAFVVRYAPVHDRGETIVGVLGLVRDVSDVIELEDRLLHAQKLDLTGRLAGGIAHDFNNLLTVIMGEIALALAGNADHTALEPLREIRRCAEQATVLTRQLLAFARREQPTPSVFALAELVTEGRHMLERLVGDEVELVSVLGDEQAWVNADRAQLEQVLANLVTNARDATEPGGRIGVAACRITVAASDEVGSILPAGEYGELAVEDSGSGMPPEVRARLFEPFFTTKGRGRGTGLGLYLSYDVVQKHGGHIIVESEIGRGTRVRVLLPHVKPASRPAPRVDLPLPTGTESILVVEPDGPVRHVTARALRASGYRVLEAETDRDAVALAEQNAGGVALLLLAVVYPSTDEDVVARIRALCPKLKVLVTSGYAVEFAERRGLIPSGADVIVKPYSPRILAERVRRVLDGNDGQ